MCQKCGCNTCETIRGPLLTEGKVKKLVSENLQYHIDKNISLMENVFRIGSDAHLSMIKEARKLYSRGVLDLCEEDEGLMETHIGEFDLYENEIVPLDLPMLEEQMDIEDEVANDEFGMDYDQLGSNEKEWVRDEIDNMSMREEVSSANFAKGIEVIRATLSKEGGAAGLEPLIKELVKLGFKKDEVVALLKNMTSVKKHRDGDYILLPLEEAYSGFLRNPEDPDSEPFEPKGAVSEFREELRALFGKFKGDLRNPEFIKGVAQIMNNWKPLLRSQLNENFEMGDRVKLTPDYEETPGEVFTITQISGNKYFIADEDGRGWYTYGGQLVMADDEYINEAKKKKAKKKDNRPIGKPMRSSSGGKAYKVYVKDPKTKKVKTVRFGSGGLRAKINDSKARKAFAARHKCSQKKDRTKASYWSCRLPRYAKLLGLKSSFSGFW